MERNADYDRLNQARDELLQTYASLERVIQHVRAGDTGDSILIRLLSIKSDTVKMRDALTARIQADGVRIYH